MDITQVAKTLEDSKSQSDEHSKQTLTVKVQILIEEACKKHHVAFFRYQDEWTFVDLKDPDEGSPSGEGKWHYAGYRGDRIDKSLPGEMREDLLAVQKLVYAHKLQVESFPNGISEKLQKAVEYRLRYLVNCP